MGLRTQEGLCRGTRKRVPDPTITHRPSKGANAFEVRVFLGYRGGEPKHKSRLVRGDADTVRREAKKLKQEVELGMWPIEDAPESAEAAEPAKIRWDARTTINDAITGWRERGWPVAHGSGRLSPTTVRRYESIWRVHIEDGIGKERIHDLSPYDVEAFFDNLTKVQNLKKKDKNGHAKIGLAPSTIHQTKALLSGACSQARRWSRGILPNPIRDAVISAEDDGEDGQDTEVRPATVDEVRSLLAAIDEADVLFAAFVRLIAATGMRRGEACAIRWEDLDLESLLVEIDEGVVALPGGKTLRRPKSAKGKRLITIDTGTAELLGKHLAATQQLAVAGGFKVESSHFAFALDLPGVEPPYPDSMGHKFTTLRKKAKLKEDLHLHSLRHFQSTETDAVLSVAQKQLRMGWATPRMNTVYTGVVPPEMRRAATHIGDLLDGANEAEPAEQADD